MDSTSRDSVTSHDSTVAPGSTIPPESMIASLQPEFTTAIALTNAPAFTIAPKCITVPGIISHESLLPEGEGEEYVEKPEPILVCSCLLGPSPKIEIPPRKEYVLTIASRTEDYLTTRRIPEFTRFLLTKLLISCTDKPVQYLENLLNDCMLFRAGLGVAPVLYERRHLEAVVKSFDPLNRGWLSAGQVRRAFITLGLPPIGTLEERTPTTLVLNELEEVQEKELYKLVTAGTNLGFKNDSAVVSWTSADFK